MKPYSQIIEEINALPRIILPHSVDPTSVPGNHRTYTTQIGDSSFLRHYGFPTEAARNEAAAVFKDQCLIPHDDVTMRALTQ